MYYDDDYDAVPRGYSDADIEQAEWEALGNRVASLRKQGICVHGWTQGTPGADGPIRCLEDGCGEVWPNEDAWADARADALA